MSIVKSIILFVAIIASIGLSSANVIEDNDMKAYVWTAGDAQGWIIGANGIANELTSQGFNVTLGINATHDEILSGIADEDVKVYYGNGHGTDFACHTETSFLYATELGDARDDMPPFTIGICNHCGDYACYTAGRWLQESTQGNDWVVAQRFYGSGWCGDDGPSGVGSSMPLTGFAGHQVFDYLEEGYTYSDAVNMSTWVYAEGRKQGNPDLRYPDFCGDVNYDMVVNMNDFYLLLNHWGNPTQYPIHSEWDGDVNGDGDIDIGDVTLLLNHIQYDYALHPRGWFI